MSVTVTLEGAKYLKRELNRLAKEMPEQASRALNKTASRSATRVRRDIAKRIGLPQRLFKEKVRNYKSSPKTLKASVWVGTRAGIPLAGIRGAKPNEAGTLLSVGRRIRVKTFPATMPSGHKGQFVRKPESKHRVRRDGQRTELPIEEPRIRIGGIARPILEHHAEDQMRNFYPGELRRLSLVTIKRRKRRRGK